MLWNLSGVEVSNYITLHLLQRNRELQGSSCPSEIVEGVLERTLFGKVNKNLGRKVLKTIIRLENLYI